MINYFLVGSSNFKKQNKQEEVEEEEEKKSFIEHFYIFC